MLSWTYIFIKLFSIRRARRDADEFEREFWSGKDLDGLYQRAASGRYGLRDWSASSRRASTNS